MNMKDLSLIEKELHAASRTFLLASQLAGEPDRDAAGKLDAVIRRVAEATASDSAMPRSMVAELLYVPSQLLNLAELPNDAPAMQAAAQQYLNRICELFPETA